MNQTFTDEEEGTNVVAMLENEVDPKINIYKFMPPAQEISIKSYSLQPDMACGWKPKTHKRPAKQLTIFPITYENTNIDSIVKQLINCKEPKKNRFAVVYLGQRPLNSYVMHQNIKVSNPAYENPYSGKHVFAKCSDRQFVGMNPKVTQTLLFDSNFESGNLDIVIKTDDNEYDLFMRVDSNTRGHTNWFNFMIKNTSFTGKIKFNICNFQKIKSLYQRGMKPYILSKKNNTGWRQAGSDITYTQQRSRYNRAIQQQSNSRNFVLSFCYEFIYEYDQVQFAYCIPYTFTKLNSFINTLTTKYTFVTNHSLWKSLSGVDVPLLTITDESVDELEKRCVVICGRVHPGESNSSIVLEGFLKQICSDNEMIKQLRKKVVFKVVPMINPDGVVAGNYRTSLFGKDLNRTFKQNRKYAFPESFYLKQFICGLKNTYKKAFDCYIDLHGHSIKKNVFIYGPEYKIVQTQYYECRDLPRILSNLTSMFRYYSCIFRISNYKDATSRAIFNRDLKITNCYTIECSNGLYFERETHQEIQFTYESWERMGSHICNAINTLTNRLLAKLRNKKTRVKSERSQKKQRNYALQPENQLLPQQNVKLQNQVDQKRSDDQISEGSSDSQSQSADLEAQKLTRLENRLKPRIRNMSLLDSECKVQSVREVQQRPVVRQQQLIERRSADLGRGSQQIQKSLIIKRRIEQDRLPPLNLKNKLRLDKVIKQTRKRNLERLTEQNFINATMIKSANVSHTIAGSITSMVLDFTDPSLRLNESVSMAKAYSEQRQNGTKTRIMISTRDPKPTSMSLSHQVRLQKLLTKNNN